MITCSTRKEGKKKKKKGKFFFEAFQIVFSKFNFKSTLGFGFRGRSAEGGGGGCGGVRGGGKDVSVGLAMATKLVSIL